MAVQTKTVFQTSDGQSFHNKDQAEDHEFNVQYDQAVELRDRLLERKAEDPDINDDISIFSREASSTLDVNDEQFLCVVSWLLSDRNRFSELKDLYEAFSYFNFD